MEDIPGEKMFGQFPKQAREESRLKRGLVVDPLVRDDFINRIKQAKGEDESECVF